MYLLKRYHLSTFLLLQGYFRKEKNSTNCALYELEISVVKDAKPNQTTDFVLYNREFFITVILITGFDCILFLFVAGMNIQLSTAD
jgi:hypothetical protein